MAPPRKLDQTIRAVSADTDDEFERLLEAFMKVCGQHLPRFLVDLDETFLTHDEHFGTCPGADVLFDDLGGDLIEWQAKIYEHLKVRPCNTKFLEILKNNIERVVFITSRDESHRIGTEKQVRSLLGDDCAMPKIVYCETGDKGAEVRRLPGIRGAEAVLFVDDKHRHVMTVSLALVEAGVRNGLCVRYDARRDEVLKTMDKKKVIEAFEAFAKENPL